MILPAQKIADRLNSCLRTNNTVVVTAPPGAGKSTLLPLTILDGLKDMQDCVGGRILILEPRRIATRQVAERMAYNVGEPVGHTVGYSMRFECKVSKETRIEVMTEGVMMRKLISDPMLEDVSVVIFDEFHERSLTSDVALALTREAQQLLRPDLRIVIMSATIDTDTICRQLHAPLVECEGRMFDVETIKSPRDRDTLDVESVARDVSSVIIKASKEHEGDILAFLPGQAEIQRCNELLYGKLANIDIFELYGVLPPEQQRRAISPSAEGERKIVLATSIAETSLTIEGVRIVVDSGLCRRQVHDQRTGLSHLETVRISRDMATQRKGRAGRVAEGFCYQLWSKPMEHTMQENRTPEIMDADLSSVVLDALSWGADDIEQLPWITPLPHANVIKAQQLLLLLGAVEKSGAHIRLTDLGSRMSQLPCHPRIAKMLVEASCNEQKSLAADIAALLEERDPLASTEQSADINIRLVLLREARFRNKVGRWSRVSMIAEQYRRQIHAREDNSIPDRNLVGRLIACAYPERVGMLMGNGNYRLSGGENAVVDTSDELSAYQWIAVASMNAQGGKVFLASPVDPLQLTLQQYDNFSWSSKQGYVIAQHEQRIGKLVVSTKPIHGIEREKIVSVIAEAAQKDGLSMFSFDDDVQTLQRRIEQVSEWHPELSLPSVDNESVLSLAPEWLPMYIGSATTCAELRKIDMCQVLWSLFNYDQQLEVDRLAPASVRMPDGRQKKLQYRRGAEAPILSVRLQECFGMMDTPRVNNGQVPVLMELLSPGFKPVQLTSDLHSFWQTTYFEVRKELRRRYPKHQWPEHPAII